MVTGDDHRRADLRQIVKEFPSDLNAFRRELGFGVQDVTGHHDDCPFLALADFLVQSLEDLAVLLVPLVLPDVDVR